jgi:hypothetical protein
MGGPGDALLEQSVAEESVLGLIGSAHVLQTLRAG